MSGFTGFKKAFPVCYLPIIYQLNVLNYEFMFLNQTNNLNIRNKFFSYINDWVGYTKIQKLVYSAKKYCSFIKSKFDKP